MHLPLGKYADSDRSSGMNMMAHLIAASGNALEAMKSPMRNLPGLVVAYLRTFWGQSVLIRSISISF